MSCRHCHEPITYTAARGWVHDRTNSTVCALSRKRLAEPDPKR